MSADTQVHYFINARTYMDTYVLS